MIVIGIGMGAVSHMVIGVFCLFIAPLIPSLLKDPHVQNMGAGAIIAVPLAILFFVAAVVVTGGIVALIAGLLLFATVVLLVLMALTTSLYGAIFGFIISLIYICLILLISSIPILSIISPIVFVIFSTVGGILLYDSIGLDLLNEHYLYDKDFEFIEIVRSSARIGAGIAAFITSLFVSLGININAGEVYSNLGGAVQSGLNQSNNMLDKS